MNRIFYFLFMACLAFSASANESKLRIVYQHLNFYIPDNPKAVGFLGTNSDILVIKYIHEPGNKFIGFSVEKDFNTGDCDPIKFLKAVFSENESECDKQSIHAFRFVFVNNRDAGIWSNNGYTLFYFIGNKKSTIFLATDGPGDDIYKIESDFLKKEEIKEIFSEYL